MPQLLTVKRFSASKRQSRWCYDTAMVLTVTFTKVGTSLMIGGD